MKATELYEMQTDLMEQILKKPVEDILNFLMTQDIYMDDDFEDLEEEEQMEKLQSCVQDTVESMSADDISYYLIKLGPREPEAGEKSEEVPFF